MIYGIYDTQDNVWLGDSNGPKLFDNNTLARISAQMTAVQLGISQTRIRAKEFKEKSVRFKGDVKTKMSSLSALKRLEDGYL